MSKENVQSLLQQALAAMQSGDRAGAGRLIDQVLEIDPKNEVAWVGRAELAETKEEKLKSLRKALEINPGNEMVKRAIKSIEEATEAAVKEAADIQEQLKQMIVDRFGPLKAGERIKEVRIVEGVWTCVFCGTEVSGRRTHCQNCGASKDEQEAYRVAAKPRRITDIEALKRTLAGPHWICASCGSPNPADRKNCASCGAPRPEKEEPPPVEAQAAKPFNWALAIGAAVVFLLVIAICIGGSCWASRTHEEVATVQSVHWERTVEIQEEQYVEKEDWKDAVPAGAEDVTCAQAERTTEKVQVGTETQTRTETKDLGDGTFAEVEIEEEVPVYEERPVYDDWCSYGVMEWTTVDTKMSSGDDLEPHWPEYNLKGSQRENKAEKYSVVLEREKGKTGKYEPKDESEFRKFNLGSKWSVEVNNLGGITAVKEK